ncbi:MAG TPA: FKBP-type peptidyl-prolyl cis-trans isomerase [Zoogloea sp.]|jgi:FKBP-type peptidyl-prolyl cis-trans isomerase SlpA|nr:FKBP-type peptidyl-prolyl cis-trans isomerase [Zoogloea sp.]TXI45200.1 MAG: peptidylprolyl isomerase [Lysobacter sp.]HOB44692.1 FKBP-type peptidyl-prolyl cis-trans isomerase [Zoogloea sp.]HQE39660.1 FKBP-type peptidyl-prolyl cis-trans isomerase [Zoogloea sp.]
MTQIVQPDSLLTLHYRITLDSGQPLISTFESQPATLQLGRGDIAPTLERCLAGITVGERHNFLLEPENAFGAHRDDLVEKVRLEDFPEGTAVEPMVIMEFTAPDGTRYPGLIREVLDTHAVIDFNHPLAGKSIRFEVEVIGIN